MTTAKHLRLKSTDLVNAAGVLRWAMNGYKLKRDRRSMITVMKSWPGLNDEQWDGILSGRIPYKTDGDDVLIDIEEE